MAKKPFTPVGKGGRMLVPSDNKGSNKDKNDKSMDWQFNGIGSDGGFGAPRGPGDMLHNREESDNTNKYAKGGGVTRFKDDHCGHADMKRGGPVKGKC